jgi:glutamate formiminotransferase/formiminotetrahydrofolate cyclodeaminase
MVLSGSDSDLVECVPNVSEGRDAQTVAAIADAVRAVEGVRLIDVDAGAGANRTVFTFVGAPAAVLEAAFRLAQVAAERIDLRRHQGAHPRMGAIDVVPFVPLGATAIEVCIDLARRLGERLGRELAIPIYLYEAAATRPERRSLTDLRSGEYEDLPRKLRDPDWAPDFGPAEFNPKSGATAVGARAFLIAYNVNLNTRERRLAHQIALAVRESGRLQRDSSGKIVRDPSGQALRVPGRLQAVRAVGWSIPEYGRAQVSLNLTDHRISGMAAAFEAVAEEAAERGLRATGSEVVGLVPLEALLDAGRYYLRRMGHCAAVPESELIHSAVLSLGLAEVGAFEPDQKVIEYQLAPARPLATGSVAAFADALSSANPTPGGGCAAALAAAHGAALAAMGAALAFAKSSDPAQSSQLEQLGAHAQALKATLLAAVDQDAQAFDAVLAARRLPKRSEAERAARERAIEAANRDATRVPLQVVQAAGELLELLGPALAAVPSSAVSDLGVALQLARAAVEGAALNVRINLPGLADANERRQIESELRPALEAARRRAEQIQSQLDQRFG